MSFPQVSFILFFVKDPTKSGLFYSKLFGLQPLEASPTFVLFELPNGLKLGLWSRTTAKPLVAAQGGGSEICFAEKSEVRVHQLYEDWSKQGISMAQTPIAMDGMSSTFVALDPDGHRIRVLCLEEEHG